MKGKLRAVWKILGRSVKGYKKDDPVKLAGTTAYFTIFAVAPILIIWFIIKHTFGGQLGWAFEKRLWMVNSKIILKP